MKRKNTIQVASPYFSNKDEKWIKDQISNILQNKLSTGPYCNTFEKKFSKFIGTKYAVFVNSCTSALEIATKFIDLKKTDEVIVPVQTFIATGTAVNNQSGKVVFAEVNPNTFCLDLSEIKKRGYRYDPIKTNWKKTNKDKDYCINEISQIRNTFKTIDGRILIRFLNSAK